MGTRTENRYTYEPDIVYAPGETLIEWLDEHGMTQTDLAARMGLSAKHVNQIAKGAAPVTTETALGLEQVTRVPAAFWNNLELNYRAHLTRCAELERLAQDVDWLDELPVAQLVKRGWITKGTTGAERVREVCSFFGVASVAVWRDIWEQPVAAYRASRAFSKDPGAVAAWLRIGEIEGSKLECEGFSKSGLRALLPELRSLTNEADPAVWVPAVRERCRHVGVAFVVEPEIRGSRLNGATRWLGPNKALVQISTRHKRHDIAWFTLFHEIGHLLLHSKKETFINDGDSIGAVEQEADAFASRVLIPPEQEPELGHLNSAADATRFAHLIGIGPGIVVGRLQHMGWWKHSEGKDLQWRFDWPPEQRG
ncbi:MAG: ImmA/IrrE family metallo-endopeptidase [Acidimicrobiaceae bacterium]|nr:ImmA/IrrE family metallo-endopeptidase [Acidimicrobiaceae bacterium]MDE0497785.1 ImmA/IrrE family metallo-endopeptidase [Acidimicrobiaceae bacterium]